MVDAMTAPVPMFAFAANGLAATDPAICLFAGVAAGRLTKEAEFAWLVRLTADCVIEPAFALRTVEGPALATWPRKLAGALTGPGTGT